MSALAELIWNSLDADATNVSVTFDRDLVHGIRKLTITDDGTGITELDASEAFTSLGGSWKRHRDKTRAKRRALHGKEGKGRFVAFSLGSRIEWKSISEGKNGPEELVIRASIDDLLDFDGPPPAPKPGSRTGTTVEIDEVNEAADVLASEGTLTELSEHFARYLRQYPDVSVEVDGHAVDPTSIQLFEQTYRLPALDINGRSIDDLQLTVVEWATPMPKSLHYCDDQGITLHSVSANIKAPGIEYSAYLSSAFIRELHEQNVLELDSLSAEVQLLFSVARAQLRDHLRKRKAAITASLVDDWKREGVYPYHGEPSNNAERTERQVFDIVAANVQEFIPDFAVSDEKAKRFSFRLLRQSIETNPESMQRIMTEVLGLPKDKQSELAELLDRTSLSAIIASAKIVADRLDMLRALETMIMDPTHSKKLLERKQLQRLLVDHTWIFGEKYHLTVDDQSLTEVLIEHRALLGHPKPNKRERQLIDPVKRLDGKDGIVDMMLSKAISNADGSDREHLVVELKRPTQPIDTKVLNQITNYALAVAKDRRFRGVQTKWVFWALSTDMDDYARAMTRQQGRTAGIFAIPQEGELDIVIIAKTWAEVIAECRGRLKFFQTQLEWTADRGASLEKLQRTHGKYFPQTVVDELLQRDQSVAEPLL